MKAKNFFRRIALAAVLVILQQSFLKAQLNPCPYYIQNKLECDVTVFVELRDASCVTMCAWSAPVLIPSGGSVPVCDAACCAAGPFDLLVFLIDVNGVPVVTSGPWVFVEINSNGTTCDGGGPSLSGQTGCGWKMDINTPFVDIH